MQNLCGLLVDDFYRPDSEVTYFDLNEDVVVQHCILSIFLYGQDCWAVLKTDARKIEALISGVYECNAVRYQMAPICSKTTRSRG